MQNKMREQSEKLETVSLNDIDGTLKRNERCQGCSSWWHSVVVQKRSRDTNRCHSSISCWIGRQEEGSGGLTQADTTPYRRSRPITHPPNTKSSINLEAVLEEVDNWEYLCDGNTSRGNEGRASG